MNMIQVRNYTSFWNLEKKLYTIYDVNLPFPIPLQALGLLFGFGLPWGFICFILHIPLSSPWFLVWFVPPVAAAWASTKNYSIFAHKRFVDFLFGQIAYFIKETKRYKGLQPDYEKYDGNIIDVKQNIMTKKYKHRLQRTEEYDDEPKALPFSTN